MLLVLLSARVSRTCQLKAGLKRAIRQSFRPVAGQVPDDRLGTSAGLVEIGDLLDKAFAGLTGIVVECEGYSGGTRVGEFRFDLELDESGENGKELVLHAPEDEENPDLVLRMESAA